MLKIAHINPTDSPVAAAGVWQIMNELSGENYEHKFFAVRRTVKDDRIVGLKKPGRYGMAMLEQQREKGLSDLLSPALLEVLQHPFATDADIVHIHSVAGGYFSYLLLPFFADKTVVWTMNDPLALTGGCYYAGQCGRWQSGCGDCPLDAKRENKPRRNQVQQVKQLVSGMIDLHIVAGSAYLREQISHSAFAGQPLYQIYGGTDTAAFHYRDKQTARNALKIPQTKKCLAFIAPGGLQNRLYGGQTAVKVLERLKEEPELLLLNIGAPARIPSGSLPVPHLDLPYPGSESMLAAWLACSDALLAPASLYLPDGGVLPAAACGVPVAAFAGCGLEEWVLHGKNGYLARKGDLDDLADGVRQTLAARWPQPEMAAYTAEKFSHIRTVEQYRQLYQKIAAPKDRTAAAGSPAAAGNDSSLRQWMEQYRIPEIVDEAVKTGWSGVWQKLNEQCRQYDEAKQHHERAVFVDLFCADCLDRTTLPADSRILWDIVEHWYQSRKMPPRCGGLPAQQYRALLYMCGRIREKLRQYYTLTPLAETVRLTEKQQLTLISLWRQVFLNAFSPLNMEADNIAGGYRQGEALLAEASRGGWYPKLILASMYAPFSADKVPIDTGTLWNSKGIPMWCKAVMTFWLVSTPYFNSEERHRQKILHYVAAFCRETMKSPQPMSRGFFRAFLEETMSGLWRSAYIGGNNVRELSVFGDFIHFFMKRFYPQFRNVKFKNHKKRQDGRLRIGYISRNFCSQAVSYYMVNRVIHHDRDQFEIFTFAVGDRKDEMTQLFVDNSDQFVRFENIGDLQAMARQIVDAKLDLLIYADIGMDPVTYMLAALQLAPVQAALVGHGITTGLPTMQYYISGDFEPYDAQQHYREKLIRLPVSGAAQYFPGEQTHTMTRRQLKIPEDAVVFVSCANGIKHGPGRDRLLIDILRQAPNAYIVIKPFQNPPSIHPGFAKRVMDKARAAGVQSRLLIIPPMRKPQDVLAVLAIADIQLDTYPYGGWTTNMEALHMGLPIVTQEGDMMRNRWGAFLLRALGIREGIAGDEAEYVAWAVKYAKDGELRRRIKAVIREKVAATLFNGTAAQSSYEQELLAILKK